MCIYHTSVIYCTCGGFADYKTLNTIECAEWMKNKSKKKKGEQCPKLKIKNDSKISNTDKCVQCKKMSKLDKETTRERKKITPSMQNLDMGLQKMSLGNEIDSASDSDCEITGGGTCGVGAKYKTSLKVKENKCYYYKEEERGDRKKFYDIYHDKLNELNKQKYEYEKKWNKYDKRRTRAEMKLKTLEQELSKLQKLVIKDSSLNEIYEEKKTEFEKEVEKENEKKKKEDKQLRSFRKWYTDEKRRLDNAFKKEKLNCDYLVNFFVSK